jgi:hypothetical protein
MTEGREGSPPALSRRAVSVPLAPGARGIRNGMCHEAAARNRERALTGLG